MIQEYKMKEMYFYNQGITWKLKKNIIFQIKKMIVLIPFLNKKPMKQNSLNFKIKIFFLKSMILINSNVKY